MSWRYGYGWRPYVSAAERRAKAAKAMAKLAKSGKTVSPVVLPTKKIAVTFWGKAWCDNLEAYSDYSNRLPRGRTYVRNGSVVDLQISKGKVTATVSGSDLYKIEIQIKPLANALWNNIQAECAGQIDSMIELLQGRLSAAVMQVVTRAEKGLFPTPKEISLKCSCPDWAGMCKHVAAALYGVGARLDEKPDLMFLLRCIDPEELISKASAKEAVRQTTSAPGAAIAEAELADVFGIELESSSAKMPMPAQAALPAQESPPTKQRRARKPAHSTAATQKTTPDKKATPKAGIASKQQAKPAIVRLKPREAPGTRSLIL